MTKDDRAGNKEYILSNGYELYQFFMANLDSVESIANLMVMHWNTPKAFEHAIKQQVEQDLDRECGDKARERLYEQEERG